MAEHGESIYALLALHWQGIDDVCRNGRIAHSHLDWNVSRIGLIGERIVTYWGVYDLQMRIGTARVRTAGVNLPVTHPDHRGRGQMAQTVVSSLEAMRAQGYGLSVINNRTPTFHGSGTSLHGRRPISLSGRKTCPTRLLRCGCRRRTPTS